MNIKTNEEVLIVSSSLYVYEYAMRKKAYTKLMKARSNHNDSIKRLKQLMYLHPKETDRYKKRIEEESKITFSIMTKKEFEKAEREEYLKGHPKKSSKEDFEYALNILPPMMHVVIGGVELFLMREFYTGTYTNQYAKDGNNYYVKMVDANDRSTWIHNMI